MDIAEAKERVLDLMARYWIKAKAIDRVALEMSQTQKEFAEIKAALEQMDLDPDAEIAALLQRLPESTESEEELYWKSLRFEVESLIRAEFSRNEAIRHVCRVHTSTPAEFKKMKTKLEAMVSE